MENLEIKIVMYLLQPDFIFYLLFFYNMLLSTYVDKHYSWLYYNYLTTLICKQIKTGK